MSSKAQIVRNLTPSMVPYLTADQLVDTLIATAARTTRHLIYRDEAADVMAETEATAAVLRREVLNRITAYEQGTTPAGVGAGSGGE